MTCHTAHATNHVITKKVCKGLTEMLQCLVLQYVCFGQSWAWHTILSKPQSIEMRCVSVRACMQEKEDRTYIQKRSTKEHKGTGVREAGTGVCHVEDSAEFGCPTNRCPEACHVLFQHLSVPFPPS